MTAIAEHARSLTAADFTNEAAATREWGLVARLVAGRDEMFFGRWEGAFFVYSGKTGHAIPSSAPTRPAAVALYDDAAQLHCLGFDLDTNRSAYPEQVRHESIELYELLTGCGFVCWIDESPTGGRHVYALLHRPRSLFEIAPLARALARRFSTLDIKPLLNERRGMLRPTGAVHKRGGFQRLLGDRAQLTEHLAEGSTAQAWWHLLAVVKPQPEQQAVSASNPANPQIVLDLRAPRLSAFWERRATQGHQDNKYPTDSELRMAIAGAAKRAGWTQAQFLTATDERWPWLFESYNAKRRKWKTAAAGDLDRAGTTVPETHHSKPRQSDTRPSSTRAGSPPPSVETRKWLTWATRRGRESSRRYTPGAQAVLRALAVFALLQKRSHIDVGCRSLSIKSGMGIDAVSRWLRTFEEDGLIWLVKEHRGVDAQVWALNTDAAAEAAPWLGPVEGVHPVFYALGGPQVAEIFEELSRWGGRPISVSSLASTLRRAESTVAEALGSLATWKLARREQRGGWVLGSGDLKKAARQLGADVIVAAKIETYREHRYRWRQWLEAVVERIAVKIARTRQTETLFDEMLLATTNEDEWFARLAAGPPVEQESDVG